MMRGVRGDYPCPGRWTPERPQGPVTPPPKLPPHRGGGSPPKVWSVLLGGSLLGGVMRMGIISAPMGTDLATPYRSLLACRA